MLQLPSSHPEIPLRPPWELRGSAWIVALKLLPRSTAREAFLPPDLAGRGRGLASLLMYVDYERVRLRAVLRAAVHPGRVPVRG